MYDRIYAAMIKKVARFSCSAWLLKGS